MQRPRPDSNRGPFDPKSDAVTDWPLRLLPSSGIQLQGDEKFEDLMMRISNFLQQSKEPMLLLFDDVKDSRLVAPLVSTHCLTM